MAADLVGDLVKEGCEKHSRKRVKAIQIRFLHCHLLTNQCDRWPLIRFVKWPRQERHYVGRGMYERSFDFIKYMLFWLVILSAKFLFAYFLQVRDILIVASKLELYC
ncbi:unnamed protein product [Trifolium pratense]|uniref:Uncharacterized protein n=1 Tax=Trifolium pratense TaxID=57577 RepID=A0ACB0JM13_TRIPR|nr:unnamed protein product [Trifolium pratense]